VERREDERERRGSEREVVGDKRVLHASHVWLNL